MGDSKGYRSYIHARGVGLVVIRWCVRSTGVRVILSMSRFEPLLLVFLSTHKTQEYRKSRPLLSSSNINHHQQQHRRERKRDIRRQKHDQHQHKERTTTTTTITTTTATITTTTPATTRVLQRGIESTAKAIVSERMQCRFDSIWCQVRLAMASVSANTHICATNSRQHHIANPLRALDCRQIHPSQYPTPYISWARTSISPKTH